MFATLIAVALAATQIDDVCRQHFGHPGDLGLTAAAAPYFTADATYPEIALTIGATGERVDTDDPSLHVYLWQGGELEMHFRRGRLAMFRIGDQWFSASKPRVSQATLPRAQASLEQVDRRQEFEEFYEHGRRIVEASRQVASGPTEVNDLRAIQYHFTKLYHAIGAGDWSECRQLRDRIMTSPSFQRGQLVAADAQRRLAERKRADEERRHKEEMARLAAIQSRLNAIQNELVLQRSKGL